MAEMVPHRARAVSPSAVPCAAIPRDRHLGMILAQQGGRRESDVRTGDGAGHQLIGCPMHMSPVSRTRTKTSFSRSPGRRPGT